MYRVLCMIVVAVFAANSAAAETRDSRFARQTALLDGRAAQQYEDSIRLQPEAIKIPGTPNFVPRFAGQYRGEFLQTAKTAARRYGIPEDIFLRLVQQESAWNPSAISSKGAVGLAQLLPSTAKLLGVNPRDPEENLNGGARYLAEQYRTFGTWRLALAAYNAGPGAVEKYGGVPPFKETQGYVKAILGK